MAVPELKSDETVGFHALRALKGAKRDKGRILASNKGYERPS